MTKIAVNRYWSILIVTGFFFAVSLFMTYNIITLPSLVLGDNFYWTPKTTADVLGPKIIRESYLGDIGVLSTFKSGFLYPLVYAFNILSIPTAIVYPFFFYFLSMLSFYSLSTEFLKTKSFSILVSVLYVVNPITPYYYASIQNAFVIIFLPLAMKFFARSVREIEKFERPPLFSRDKTLCAFFLVLSVSAHEQFILSALLIGVFFLGTQALTAFKKDGLKFYSVKLSATTLLTYLLMFTVVNLPLLFSLLNVRNAPLSVYFSGRIDDFISYVQYNYSTLTSATLLRFGGDSGVGLGTTSWYDSSIATNWLGYSIFLAFATSVLLLLLRRKSNQEDGKFYWMNVILFTSVFFLLLVVKQLPYNRSFLEAVFSFVLQTWANPIKIRVILLLSALAVTLFALRTLESLGTTKKKRVLTWCLAGGLMLSVIGYNSPWLINYAGYTPIQQIADLKQEPIFSQQYVNVANNIEQNISQERGIIIPYTTNSELYSPPNFRLFQMISGVNTEASKLTQGEQVDWSKTLGLLSAKSVILNEAYDPNETVTFPLSFQKNATDIIEEMRKDSGFSVQENTESATILENKNALPLLYATNYYVFYDETSTLKYALRLIDMGNLPVFFRSEGTDQIRIPEVVSEDTYEVYAVSHKSDLSLMPVLLLSNSTHKTSVLYLSKTAVFEDVDIFSTLYKLSPGDTISTPGKGQWDNSFEIKELVLNSTLYSLGTYNSFRINSTVSILERGQYSFLGPRIVIDSGSEQYYLIFHDYGVLELATMKDGEFNSGRIYRSSGFDLTNENSSISVCVSRVFDEIQVFINGFLEMSFPVETKAATVYLSSELSTSRFTDISGQTCESLRLFAVRKIEGRPDFTAQQVGAEASRLIVANSSSDFAVVCQYLNTPLRVIKTGQPSYPVTANIFFSGWIMQPENPSNQETLIEISAENATLTMGLAAFSIISFYIICIVALQPSWGRRVYSLLVKYSKRLKPLPKQGGEKAVG